MPDQQLTSAHKSVWGDNDRPLESDKGERRNMSVQGVESTRDFHDAVHCAIRETFHTRVALTASAQTLLAGI